MVLPPVPGELLEHRAGVEPHAQLPAQLVEHVADAYVLCLAEYPVAALGVGDDLGVASGCVEERRVVAAALRPPDLHMRDAVVDPDDRHPQGARERPGGGPRDPEAGAEAGTHGERHQTYVGHVLPCGVQRPVYDGGHDLRMMVRGLSGVETPLLGTEHVQLVGQDVAVVVDYPHPERVRGPLYPQCEHETVEGHPPIKHESRRRVEQVVYKSAPKGILCCTRAPSSGANPSIRTVFPRIPVSHPP